MERPQTDNSGSAGLTRPSVCFVATSEAMLHVLNASEVSAMGGAEIQVGMLARELRHRGWPVSFLVGDYGQPAQVVTPEGITAVHAYPQRSSDGPLNFLLNSGLRFWRSLKATDAEVYLQRGVGGQGAVIAAFCRSRLGRKKRFVLWSASITDALCTDPQRSRLKGRERRLAAWGLRYADVVIVQTEEQRHLVAEHHGREAMVIPNMWPAPLAQPVPPADPPEVLWAARFIELKRPHWVLDLAERLPQIRFVMAGGPSKSHPELFESVRARAQTLPNVSFLGFVPFEEMDAHYARASAYLCTSTVEGFPNTFLQSWSHGRPVITTYDPDSIVQRHGLGCYGSNLGELAEAVAALSRATDGYAERTRSYLEQHHSCEAVVDAVEGVLSGSQPASAPAPGRVNAE